MAIKNLIVRNQLGQADGEPGYIFTRGLGALGAVVSSSTIKLFHYFFRRGRNR